MSSELTSPNSDSTTTIEEAILHQPSKTFIVDDWLKSSYLRYTTKVEDEGARNDCGISTGQFLEILQISGRKSWFENEVVDLALSQLTDIHKRTDCYVLPTHYAAQLCHFGAGKMEQDAIPVELLPILRDERKRFVIVPCNDAMLINLERQASSNNLEADDAPIETDVQDPNKNSSDITNESATNSEQAAIESEQPQQDERAAQDDTEGAEDAEQPSVYYEEPRASTRSLGQGAHWGLMIIDTQEDTARWLDGLLDIRSREKDGNRVVYIHSMLSAGIVAGKILCGYDRLLDRDPGHFTTSTIKWVPHQKGDNTDSRDNGACGPHMFACLKHLLEEPGALEDIYAHFRRGNAAPGNFRRGRKGFNSSITRKEISDQILEERGRGLTEAALEPSLALEADVMDILGLRVTPEKTLQAVRAFKSATQDEDDEELPSFSEGLYAQSRHDMEQRWLEDQEDHNVCAILDEANITTLDKYIAYREVQKDELEKAGRVAAGYEPVGGVTRRIFLGQKAYNVPTDDRAIWPPHSTDTTLWKEGADKLPDFAKIKTMHSKEIGKWMSKNKNPDLQKKSDDLGEEASATTRRAMLHHKFKKTFLGEPDENLNNVWINDSAVFGTTKNDRGYVAIRKINDPQLKAGEIRLRMMLHYEGELAVRRVTHPKKSKPTSGDKKGGGNDKPDDNSGKDGGNNPDNPSELPEDGDLPSDNEGDKLDEAYRNNEPASNSNPTNKNNGGGNKTNSKLGLTHPPPTGILNYPTMPDDQLELEKEKYREKLNDPRFQHRVVNNNSWRAILYVDVQGGRFEKDSDAVCEDVWLQDTVVFNWMHRILLSRLTTTKQSEVSRIMGNHYYIRSATASTEPADISTTSVPGAENGPKNDGPAPPAKPITDGSADTYTAAAAATVDGSNVPASQGPNDASSNRGTKRKNDATDPTSETIVPNKKAKRTKAPLNVQTMTNSGRDEDRNNSEPSTKHGSSEHDTNGGRHNIDNDAGKDSNSSAGGDGDQKSDDDDDDDQPPRGADGVLAEPRDVPAEIDFRTMPFEQLQTYMTDERRADARLRDLDPNIASWRAFLYVSVQGRHFEDASDDDCITYWLQDSIVFNDADRELDWVAMGATQFIRDRMTRHYLPTPDISDISNFSDSESESENGSSVPSKTPFPLEISTGSPRTRRQQAQKIAQNRLMGLGMAAGQLSQIVDQHLLSLDFTPDDGDDGDSTSSDSTLTWPSHSPTNPESSSGEDDSSYEGSPGCGPAIGKHPRDPDDDDLDDEGSLSKKPKTEANQPPPPRPAEGGADNTDPDSQQENSGQSSAPNANASFSSEATVEDETVEIYIGRQAYILDPCDTSIFLPFDTTRVNWPARVTELPNFAGLASPALNRWRKTNLDMNLPASLGLHQYTTALARLHMRFKRTFMHEPDENFTSTWIHDGNVFTDEHRAELRDMTNDLFRNGEIRRYMLATYEPEMLRRVEAMPKPRPANPKITVQKGTFEDPESFKSDVHVGKKPVPKRRESVDGTRLSPNEARVREGRARYSMREKPKQSQKKRGSP